MYSGIDTKGKLCVDCSECDRGGNGSDPDKCSCGHKIKKPKRCGCYIGILMSKYHDELKKRTRKVE